MNTANAISYIVSGHAPSTLCSLTFRESSKVAAWDYVCELAATLGAGRIVVETVGTGRREVVFQCVAGDARWTAAAARHDAAEAAWQVKLAARRAA